MAAQYVLLALTGIRFSAFRVPRVQRAYVFMNLYKGDFVCCPDVVQARVCLLYLSTYEKEYSE